MEKISLGSVQALIDRISKKYPEIMYEMSSIKQAILSLNQQSYTFQLFQITDKIRKFLKECLSQIPALSILYKRYLELIQPLSHHHHNHNNNHNKGYDNLHSNSTKMKQNLIMALKQQQEKSQKDLDDLYTGMSETLLRKQNTIQQLQRQLRTASKKYVTFETLPNDLFKIENQQLKDQINNLTLKIQSLEAQKLNNLQIIRNLKQQTQRQISPRSTLESDTQKIEKVIEKTVEKVMTNISHNHHTPTLFNEIGSNQPSGWQQFSERNITNPYNLMSPLSDDPKNKSQIQEKRQKSNYGMNSNVKSDEFWRFIFIQVCFNRKIT